MANIGYKYYRFGSADSIDIDILIDHPEANGIEDDKKLIKGLKERYPIISDWNINIIAIENGVVVKSIPSKGLPDGVNNSLYETYHLHEQKFPFPLEKKLARNIDAAIEKCLTAIFTFYKRTNHDKFYKSIPKEIKNGEALLKIRLDKLKEIDFNNLPYADNEKNRNAYKSIAFHIGQTISLIDGIEIYTKKNLINNHSELKSIINRVNSSSIDSLNLKNVDLTNKIKTHYGLT